MATQRENVFSLLSEHMLTREKLGDWLSNVEVEVEVEVEVDKTPKVLVKEPKTQNRCVIMQRDKLLWSFYIIVFGLDCYHDAKEKMFSTENTFKYESISKMREKKQMMKGVKLKPQDIESILISNTQITIQVLHALAIAYEKSIVFMHDRIYYEFPYGDKYFLIEKKNNDIILHLDDQSCHIAQIKREMFHMNHVNKSIKGIASYTIKQLQEIAVKLQISTVSESGKPLTKPNLYNVIVIKMEKLT